MPTMFLTGPAAASGIAWINSLGNLGGFFGPTIVGWAKQLTGSFAGGLYALAICALVSAEVSLFGMNLPRWVRVPEAATIPRRVNACSAAVRWVEDALWAGQLRCTWAFAHRLGMARSWSGNEVRMRSGDPGPDRPPPTRRKPGPDLGTSKN